MKLVMKISSQKKPMSVKKILIIILKLRLNPIKKINITRALYLIILTKKILMKAKSKKIFPMKLKHQKFLKILKNLTKNIDIKMKLRLKLKMKIIIVKQQNIIMNCMKSRKKLPKFQELVKEKDPEKNLVLVYLAS